MERNWSRAALAGLAGTLVMTAVGLWLAPMMGAPRMNPAEMLAGAMGGSLPLGWMAHVMIGVLLACGYAIVAPALPGTPFLRGASYGVAPWLLAQLVVMPMMGGPLFGGSALMAMGSLVGHLVYGAVVGAVYGQPRTVASGRAAIARAHG